MIGKKKGDFEKFFFNFQDQIFGGMTILFLIVDGFYFVAEGGHGGLN